MRKILSVLALCAALFVLMPASRADGLATLTVTQKTTAGKFAIMTGTIVFSGSYATGGDTLSLTGLQIPGTVAPRAVFVTGQAGYMYQYTGTTRSNGKVKVYVATTSGANIPLAEHTAAAYAAGVTGDTVTILVLFDSLR